MSRYQGIRARQMLAKINKEIEVTQLRHPSTEEYQEVFGKHYHQLGTHASTSRRSDARQNQRGPSDISAEIELQSTSAEQSLPLNVSAENELQSMSAEQSLPLNVSAENELQSMSAEQSLPLNVSAENELQFTSAEQCQPFKISAENELQSISGEQSHPLNISAVNELQSMCTEQSKPFNSAAFQLQALTADEFRLVDVSPIWRKQRSWSLSDLTRDTTDTCNTFFRKARSAPLLSEELTAPYSPSLLAFYTDTSSMQVSQPENEDFDDISTESESEVAEYGNTHEGRKRRHIPDPNSWKRNQAKNRRMRGEEYLGYTKPRQGKFQQNSLRSARELGETCQSGFCRKSKFRGCSRFTEENRKKIHEFFWQNMNWDQRKIYVNSLVTRSGTTRKTKTESRREGTFLYFLPISKDATEKVQVCRQMFLKTLSLGSFTVQSWVKRSEFGMIPNQEVQKSLNSRPKRPEIERKMLTLDNFLNWLPKMPSHYARKETNKLFVEPMYHSLVDLYTAYKKYCNEIEEPQVSRFTFEKQFHQKNLSLYTLKKDMCDVCASYKAGNIDEADYQIHIIKKDRARKEKHEDKKKAEAGEIILLTMDLEAVKLCPSLTASALYFKTKLACHNFTMYNLKTNHCTCYWFDETAADITASTFASFIIDYIERHCMSLNLPIVIYSDGCTYQNRNALLANGLLNFSKNKNVIITQKFLEPGHTQMECDSVHSAIERKLKNREIHLPSNYVTLTKEARMSKPYETVQVDYQFVKDYTQPENSIYKSIRPGRRAGDPQVVDIRGIRYNTMTIEVKLNFDSDWIPLLQRPKVINSSVPYPQLHSDRIPISLTKYNHLQQLKSVLPSDCHAFYDNLPHTNV